MNSDNKQRFAAFTGGYTFKAFLLIVLVLLFLIPLDMISGIVSGRRETAREAENGIMRAWGAGLVEAGPVIVIPGVRTEERRTKSDKAGVTAQIVETPFTLVIAPEALNIKADLAAGVRRRGIFSVPLFSGSLELSGVFDPARALASLAPNETLRPDRGEIIITLENQKGIRKIESALWDGAALFFEPGNRGCNLIEDKMMSGISAALPVIENRPAAFSIVISIQGGKEVRFAPLGKDTHVEISSDWKSPGFQGDFLPASSELRDDGFSAVWDVSYLTRDIPLFWTETGKRREFPGPLFGVDFYSALDTYALNTRAMKYAVLFLIIPFLTLFLLEVFSKKRIHPVPYLLSGIGNIVFYLLLLSLSEQMPFYTAYLAAALAVAVMLTLYSRSLLSSRRQCLYYGCVAALSYLLLYAVLNAESYALLIGSCGTFLVTALVMFVTRKLDWYNTAAA